MGDGGKGSAPRPFSVSQAEYESRWDAIFGRDLKKDEADTTATANSESAETPANPTDPQQ